MGRSKKATPVTQPYLFGLNELDPAGERILAPVRVRALACVGCKLSEFRSQVVFGVGNSNKPDLAFLGTTPTHHEDADGTPFGASPEGRKLDELLVLMGYKREDVYLTYTVMCRPPNERTPERPEVQACSEHLIAELRAVRPKVIVALGALALIALGSAKIEAKARGVWTEWGHTPVMPTFSLSTLAQNPESFRLAWQDMRHVLAKLGKTIPS